MNTNKQVPVMTIAEINRAIEAKFEVVKPATLVYHAAARMNELAEIVKDQLKMDLVEKFQTVDDKGY